MSIQRSIRLSLAGAIALAMYGVAAVAMAQPAASQSAQQVPPPPMPPPPPAAPAQPMPPPPPPVPPQSTMPATAQPPPPPAATGQSGSGQLLQGTQSSASYPLPDSNGGTLTVNSGMPANVQNYGPAPSFKSLDTNHDGRISEAEARAYPPLDSDFLYASGQGKSISRAQYTKWVQGQGE